MLVTDGALVFDIAGIGFEIGSGDSLHFGGDRPHRWADQTSAPTHAVWFALRDT